MKGASILAFLLDGLECNEYDAPGNGVTLQGMMQRQLPPVK